MSILMEALKQQTQPPASTVAATDAFWRKLALLLALLVALLVGVLAGYLLMPLLQPASPAASVLADDTAAAVPADAAVILTALSDVADEPVTVLPLPNLTPEPEARVVEALPQPKAVVTVTTSTIDNNNTGTDSVAANANTARSENSQPAVEVSAELRDKFASALQATEHGVTTNSRQSGNAPAVDISRLDRALLQQIPSIRFDAHVYATSSAQRWVKVNGKTLQEGQWVTADIRIKEITQQYVLLEFGQTLFSMAALSSWPQN